MQVRDAVEADAGRMAEIADAPSDVMRNLVHDRTVRVAEAETADASDPNEDVGDPRPDPDEREESDLLGFVSYDARNGVVHVTQIDGTPEACELLLGEPVRFARQEGMTVELLVPEAEGGIATAAEAVGFSETGPGPRFDGDRTVRYRLDPT